MSADWRSTIEVAIKVVGLFAAIFGVYKYFDDIAEARRLAARQAALAYVATYNGPELKSRSQTLFEFWIRNSDAMVFMQTNGMSDADYRSFLLTAFEHDDHPEQLLDAVYALSTFYDQVELCRSARVCDTTVVQAHFCKNAGEFSRKYQPIFAQLAVLSAVPDFGGGTRTLGQSC
ncbi:hypothetical protein [Rhizobium leguminosarum]|uniref:hypothetical protein n=1 Tax=Rhizobium leguminosarum TaxID=384 RepID=UPI00103BB74E|nr:hypothetical protein [Rhizobium leguminosarum]TBY81702.1 hypothetical protein E0H32_15565 [Rhizobium leguminosarum bv. viciae]